MVPASLVAGLVALVSALEVVASDEAGVAVLPSEVAEEVIPESLSTGVVAFVSAPEVVASDEAEVVVLPP